MSIFKQIGKAGGQALIELMIILPVLILFSAVIVPLLVRGIGSTWVDERLTLRLLGQDNEHVHQLLMQTHRADRMPAYFQKDDFWEGFQIAPLGVSIPFLGNGFPGKIHRKLTNATLDKNDWWNRLVLGDPKEEFSRLSRSLSMVAASQLEESRVPEAVRKLALLGVAQNRTDILESFGLDLFHLNLDALPKTGSQGQGK